MPVCASNQYSSTIVVAEVAHASSRRPEARRRADRVPAPAIDRTPTRLTTKECPRSARGRTGGARPIQIHVASSVPSCES
jgi:hypothetical protein